MAQHSALEIMKVILTHNKLVSAEDVEVLMADVSDPEEVIDKMLIGEMINDDVAQKVLSLYHRNLEKQGIQGGPAPVTNPVPAEVGGAGHNGARHAEVHAPHTAPPGSAAAHQPHDAAASRHEPGHARHDPVPSRQDPSPSHSAPAPAIGIGEHIDVGTGGKPLILKLLRLARQVKASDLHIKAGARPIVRVCTLLRELDCPELSPQMVEQSLLDCLTDKQRQHFTEKNDIDFSLDTEDSGRFRGNYMREHRGIDGTFRLVPSRVPSFEELKLPESLKRFTSYRQGIVLVTGPKGSGKTTTLAALIDLINATRPEHIITVEDPIEFVHPSKKGHVNQREVGVHTDSFANALRAALREAPDIIMVGEMRDLETISLAITAAETGHLVFGTLHTPDAPRTINRVLDVYPPEEQPQVRTMFSESLRGIVCQQLVPADGGKAMHLATEILFNTSAISNLIRENRAFQVKGMMQTGKKLGMTLMDESLVKLVKDGKISRQEAMNRAENPHQMEKDLTAP